MTIRSLCSFLGVLLSLCAVFERPLQAQQNDSEPNPLQILYYEPLELSPAQAALKQNDTETMLTLTFQAFDQDFTLTLQPNQRLLENLPKDLQEKLDANIKLYRGSLKDVENSWARLSNQDGSWSGIIWDGSELYLIDSVAAVSAALSEKATTATTAQTVIYRVSDTVRNEPVDYIVTPPGRVRPKVLASQPHNKNNKYGDLVGHLRALADALPAASQQLDIALLADTQFVQLVNDPEAEMLRLINQVDGIYSEQVGVRLNIIELRPLNNNGPLTSSNAGSLLGQLSRFVDSSVNNPGLVHLFTGRDLSGNTIGIAYLGVLCDRRFGVGLSQTLGLGSSSALIVAHELGHNFGAPHDNQGGSVCAGTPGNFLMNPFINGSDQFSQCSLSQMQPNVAAASCISPINGGASDLSLSLPVNPLQANVNMAFDFAVQVQNAGQAAASNTRVSINLPAAVSTQQTPDNCSSSNNRVDCQLGALAAAASRTLNLTLQAQQAGTFTSDVTASADNDADTTNNSVQARFVINAAPSDADLRLELPNAAIAGKISEAFTVQASVSNQGQVAANNASITVELPAALILQAITSDNGSCNQQSKSCQLGNIAAAGSRNIELILQGEQAGEFNATFTAQAANDTNTSNNSADAKIQLTDTDAQGNIVVRHSGQCLTVRNGSRTNGANVVQQTCGGLAHQQWTLIKQRDNIYQIKADHSDQCLDVDSGSRRPGANILQWPCHGGANQLWRLVPRGDVVLLQSVMSGQCIDVDSGSRRSGANALQWPCHGDTNQQWQIDGIASDDDDDDGGDDGDNDDIPDNPIIDVCANESAQSYVQLRSGDAVCIKSTNRNSNRYFYIWVPQATQKLTLRLGNGSGNADLYYGSRNWPYPGTASVEQASVNSGNAERIVVNNPRQNAWHHIAVVGDDGHNGVSILAEMK